MMGERSSPFISGIAVLLICAQLLCFSASQSTTCTMPSVEEGQATTLTCEFGFNLQDEERHRDVIIKRLRGTMGKTEELLDCYWERIIKDYRCKVKQPRFYFNDHITEHVTLQLPSASKEDEWLYFCDVTGSRGTPCNFTVKAKMLTTCTMPSVEEGQTAELTCLLPSTMENKPPEDIIIKRKTDDDRPEEIGECFWKNGNFTCEEKLNETAISYNNAQVSLLLYNGKKKDEGIYVCETPRITAEHCFFTVRDRPDVNTTTLIRPEVNTTTLSLVTVVMVVSVLLNLVLILYLKMKRGQQSGHKRGVYRLLPCTSSKEENPHPEGNETMSKQPLQTESNFGELINLRPYGEQGSPEDKKVREA